MKLFRRKKNRKMRNVIMALLVGAACLFLVAYYLDVPGADLQRFLVATIVLVLGIIGLAVVTVAIVNGLRRLGSRLRHRGDEEDANSRQ